MLIHEGGCHQLRVKVFRPLLDPAIMNLDDKTVGVVVRPSGLRSSRPLHLCDDGIPFRDRVLDLSTNAILVELLSETPK